MPVEKLVLFVFGLLLQTHLAIHADDSKLTIELPTPDDSIECKADESTPCTVVYFFSTECPLARLYAQRLIELHSQFAPKVRFVGVNSTTQDSMPDVKSFAMDLAVPFPLAKDYGNKVADQYGATRTAEVFLLDSKMEIAYQGRIDDQYSPGVSRSKADRHFLKDAIEAVLAGNEIALAQTDAVGCLIGKEKRSIENPTVTYTKQISRLIQSHCIECHRRDQIGPFSLEDYEEVKGWAEMMVEVTQNRRMPPWHATREHLQFKNERFLTENELKLFSDWLEQGTPYGDATQLPKPRSFVEGWRLPKKPDQIVEMKDKPFVVPAAGTVEYQYFVVDPGFTSDKWIWAAEVIPGNRSVVHHSIVFIRPPDGARFRGLGWLAAYVPGQGMPQFKPTHATFVPAGSKFVFQQHYTPTGTQQTDITKIGVMFANRDQLTHEVYTLAAMNQEFEIPAGEPSHGVRSSIPRFPKDGAIVSFAPHMHYRGKAFQLFCSIAGTEKQLIDVPAYDFNWQHTYQPAEPIPFADIEKISCRFQFDNSPENPFNPDPSKTVTWGDQTWEEMAVAFFEVAQPIDSEDAAPSPADPPPKEKVVVNNDKVEAFVNDFFERFDADSNDELVRDELPRSIRRFGFWQYDLDSDGILTRDELRIAAAKRIKK